MSVLMVREFVLNADSMEGLERLGRLNRQVAAFLKLRWCPA